MAKLELPELEQNQEVNATKFVQDAGKIAPQRTKQKTGFIPHTNNCLNSLITNQKTASPQDKDNQSSTLAYQDLDENELINFVVQS